MKRSRKHIPLIEIAASALADKLPQSERDALREAKVPATQIVRMFTPDHIWLHSLGGPDSWWNLDMRRRGTELKAKDARDTGIAAKSKRIVRGLTEHQRAMQAKLTGRSPVIAMPKSKIASRGFQKRYRPLHSRGWL